MKYTMKGHRILSLLYWVILGRSGSRLTSCYCVYMDVMYATQIGVPVRGEVGREILDLV